LQERTEEINKRSCSTVHLLLTIISVIAVGHLQEAD